VRKKIGDIRGDFPQGIQGPGFDDEFGDVYGTIYAFTGDGFTMRQLRDYVEQVRTGIRDVPNRGKVMTIGEQDETFYLDFSTRKLAALGLDQQHILQSLQEQNAVTPAGVIEAGPERMSVRTSGQFHSTEDLKRSTCGSMTVSIAWRTLLKSPVVMLTRPRRCSITTASPPLAWPSP
jgi:multidrug efflux pump